MSSVLVTAILGLIQKLLPTVFTSESGVIGDIVAILTEAMPSIIQEAQTLAPAVKNIIAALSNNPATTAEQFSQLQALDQQCDAAFEAAAAATDAGT